MLPLTLSGGYRGSGKLEGKVAVISGGDSGIGRAVAVHFAREGAATALLYLEERKDATETKRLVEEEGAECMLRQGDVGDEDFCSTFRTNFFGYFFLTRAALPHLKRGAASINTTSMTAYRGSEDLIDYSATKGAIVAFTRSLAQALVKREIRVNGVAPAFVYLASQDASYVTGQVLHPNGGDFVTT